LGSPWNRPYCRRCSSVKNPTGIEISFYAELQKLCVQNFGEYGDPHNLIALAVDAEQAGWDGFFMWDHLQLYRHSAIPVVDAWIALAGIAARTEHLKIGPVITPLARRRPWKVAREVVSLDQLSRGRLVFGVGLGAPPDAEFDCFGEDPSDRVRAHKLDEGLTVLDGYGRAKLSATRVSSSILIGSSSSHERCNLRVCQCGLRDSGRTNRRCGGLLVGTACFH